MPQGIQAPNSPGPASRLRTTSATTPTSITLTIPTTITLSASTTYWFVLSDIPLGFTWNQDTTASTPAQRPVVIRMSAPSTQFSGNSGGLWSTTTTNPSVQINVNSLSTSTPEPSTWALAGIGGLLLLAARRHKSAV